jgi:threonine synthase
MSIQGPAYRSTRGGGSFTFREALLQGLAPDGGLFVPEFVPEIPNTVWRTETDFPTLAETVLLRWLAHEIPPEHLGEITRSALNFPVPLIPLSGKGWQGVSVLELFHGPTLSFKDFGARTMARMMRHFLEASEERLSILVATSGDTGSAVADGFSGMDQIRVFLLYPKGQVSPTQERQLIVERPGVRTFAVEGTFDDCQRMVKAAFLDPDLAAMNLSSANSINIGRLLPQMLYYIRAIQERGEDLVFSVPSGNLGNLTGGLFAALGGLPVHRFLAAHNANDYFPAVLSGRDVRPGLSRRTLSNAMDVGVPSNFERITALLTPEEMRARIWGTSVGDEETVTSMQRVFEETGYVADPHTAVGLEAVRRYRTEYNDATPAVVLATAHPAKFPETVERALSFRPKAPRRLAQLFRRETRVHTIAPTLEALKGHLIAHD